MCLKRKAQSHRSQQTPKTKHLLTHRKHSIPINKKGNFKGKSSNILVNNKNTR